MRLPNVDIGRLWRLNYELVCHFELAADTVRGGIREFMNDKNPDVIPDHVCHQFELIYQLVVQS